MQVLVACDASSWQRVSATVLSNIERTCGFVPCMDWARGSVLFAILCGFCELA